MGRQRQQQQGQAQLVAIATALAAGGTSEELASAIVAALPIAADAAGGAAVAERVALEVARIAIVDVPEVADSGFLRRVSEEQLIYRAAYIRAAVSRLASVLIRDPGRLGDALATEERYFQLHRQQELRRRAGGGLVAEAIERYGDLLGWYTTIRPTNRPNHRAAHRHNWRPLLGPPVLTGAYPGVLPNCLCEVGPPIAGAQIIS